MAEVCKSWQIPYLNLADINHPEEITRKITEVNPKIILCSIENLSDPAIQKRLQKLKVAYVSVDESQVRYNLWFSWAN